MKWSALFLGALGCVACATLPVPEDDETRLEGQPPALRQAAVEPALGGSSPQFAEASVQIMEPRKRSAIDSDEISVVLNVESYSLERGGPKAGVVFDNEPVRFISSAGEPMLISPVKPGTHLVRAFLVRPSGESVKFPGAFDVSRFANKVDDQRFDVDPDEPILTYNLPAGSYEGERTKRILFDFVLSNDDLSQTHHRIHYSLDGKDGYLNEWKPLYWENLKPGEHRVMLELLDQNGLVVENGEVNHTERVFFVR